MLFAGRTRWIRLCSHAGAPAPLLRRTTRFEYKLFGSKQKAATKRMRAWKGRTHVIGFAFDVSAHKLVSFVWRVRHSKIDKTSYPFVALPPDLWTSELRRWCMHVAVNLDEPGPGWNLPAEIELVSPSKFRWPMAAAVSSTASKPVNEMNGRTNESPFYS